MVFNKRSKPIGLRIPYALAVHDEKETQRVVKVLQEHRTNTGKETAEFEERVKKLFGRKYGLMVNSGSSANFLAYELLNFPPNSEIITPLLTFSTTIAPIVQHRLIPVFTDVDEGKYTINVTQIEQLITKRTKAIMIPLLLGNVPDMEKIAKIAKKHKLFVIEDSCDTIGATIDNKPSSRFSDITTTSFFGSHIITAAGNGGMILFNNDDWVNRAKMLRGWGRSSSIFSESESIEMRFKKKIDNINYDAKFVFEEIGFNFLAPEICAAFGNEQIKKLPKFKRTRERNFRQLRNFLAKYEEYFILPIQDPSVSTQWLAFPITIKKKAPFTRLDITTFLEKNNIQTRPVFTGNILKQPGFTKIAHKISPSGCPVTNGIMERGFVVGCHHGLTAKQLKKLKYIFATFLASKSRGN